MKTLETIHANKWYPLQNGKPLYPTPQSVLRKAVGAEDYKFISETVTTDHIRASAIMPLDVPFQHLLFNEPWAMSFKTPEWRMLIVSTLDPTRWLELARASGAKGWLKGHNMTVTYNWQAPDLDAQGNKIRPSNSAGNAHVPEPGTRSDKGSVRKKYNKQELLSDLRDITMTQAVIADKHGLSRFRVIEIAKAAGLSRRNRVKA